MSASGPLGLIIYQVVVTEEGSDLEAVSLPEAECRLVWVDGDHVHRKYFWCMERGI